MKLSPAELTEIARQVAAREPPRADPLSVAALIAERKAALERARG